MDALCFNKTAAMLGGKVRYMLTASAPIDPTVLQFIKIVFCCPVVEVYGLTECAGGVTSTKMNDPVTGHVGGAFYTLKARLLEVPEMSYFPTDKPYPRGELCLYGPQIFNGYFKRPDKTAEAFD